MHKTALPILFSFLLRVTLIRSDVVGNGFSPHKTALPMDGFWNHIMHPIPFQSLASGEEQDQTSESSPGANIKSMGTDGYNSSSSGIATSGFDPFDESLSKIYRYRRQQSVNLGSWFVHEEWMTPSVFESAKDPKVSEIDIALGDNARTFLENYWSTFITQADFNYLASIGINTVRLPIGYWSLGPSFCSGTPFQSVASVYTKTLGHGIKRWDWSACGLARSSRKSKRSDLQPHSGVSDGQTGLFDNPDNIGKTLNVLIFLTQQLVNVTNVVGIQILNEPNNVQSLEDFYTKAIAAMRNTSAEARFLPLYVHNGFDLDRFTRYINSRTDFVVQDHHSYFVFTGPDSTEPASQHTSDVHTIIAAQLATSEPKDPFLTVDAI
ncbi:Glucan 1,3-beta-glucosidase 3 [Paramarasmius palmivorus]|uniref:Glucan 1,3-beta-glucosidase 3 n=1 Tax=Paramarasmius palmivorus TaxID=297713 RepID=A0AAW0DPN8_9AGAR